MNLTSGNGFHLLSGFYIQLDPMITKIDNEAACMLTEIVLIMPEELSNF